MKLIDQMNQRWKENIHQSPRVNRPSLVLLPLLIGCVDVCVFRGRLAAMINGQLWAHSIRSERVIMHIKDFPYS